MNMMAYTICVAAVVQEILNRSMINVLPYFDWPDGV